MEINLNQENEFEKQCELMAEMLRKDQLPVIICGDVDEKLYIDFFKKENIKLDNVYDRSPKLRGKEYTFGKVINASDIEKKYKEYNAVIVVPYYDEIKELLHSLSSKPRNVFFLDIAMLHSHPTMFLDKAKEVVSQYLEEYKQIYNDFDDKESKIVWENLINYWLGGRYQNVQAYKGLQGQQYLDFFELTQHEVFVNCGAFDARYSKKFIDLVDGKYDQIFNIECDENNYSMVCENMQLYSNVTNIKKGLHSKKEILKFNAMGNGMSCIEDDGAFSVEVDRLDNMINERVTFIKMDIEGAEYDAISGASSLIQTYKPKMAVCIYHNIEDFIKIPRLIKSLDTNYKFAVRHYTDTLTETVLYAWV